MFKCICQLCKECSVHNKGEKTCKKWALELQWHKHLCCKTSIRWPGPDKHSSSNTNRLRRHTEQGEVFPKKENWQHKWELTPIRWPCSVTSVLPPVFKPKRTPQQQKNIQITCLCLLLLNIAFCFHTCYCIVLLHTPQQLKSVPELHNSVSVATLKSCMFQPSTPSACPSHTQHACTCSKTQSQTRSLTTCNNSGPGKSRPGWIVQQEAMEATLLPDSKHCSRGHTSYVVGLNVTQRSSPPCRRGWWALGAGQGKGEVSAPRGRGEGDKSGCVCLGGGEQGGRSPPPTSRAKGAVVGTVPASKGGKRQGPQRGQFPLSGTASSAVGSDPPLGGSHLLSPQGSACSCSLRELLIPVPIAFFSDVDHSSFLSHALNEEGEPL